MMAPLPTHEEARLAALKQCLVLDTPPEREFDDLCALAARLLRTPIALLSLVDRSRQWFKARVGVDMQETPRAEAFCAHAILQADPLVVSDATRDPRFADNPAVTGPRHIRFYAGAPIMTDEGHVLGALCVKDNQPRQVSSDDLRTLESLALQASGQLCLRRALSFWAQSRAARHSARQILQQIARDAEREIRTPLTAILGFAEFLEEHPGCQDPECAEMVQVILRNGRQLISYTDRLTEQVSGLREERGVYPRRAGSYDGQPGAHSSVG